MAKKKIRILLDGASNRCLCRRAIVNELLLSGEPTDLTLNLAGGHTLSTTRERKTWILLENLDCSFRIRVQVTTSRRIGTLPPMLFNPRDYEHLRGIPLTDQFPVKRDMCIDLLVGEPVYSHLLQGSPILGQLGEPGAQKTKLGWALCASDPSKSTAKCFTTKAEDATSLASLCQIMMKFNDLETLGIRPPQLMDEKYTEDELEALQVFKEGASFDEHQKRWIVRLPWKGGKPENNSGVLNNNFKRAVAIMHRVEEKTRSEDREGVNEAYREIVDQGWAEPVPADEMFPEKFWYCLITRPVIRWQIETTPVRIVMDASARDAVSKKSLNDLLHLGPCLLPEVAEILIRFRQSRWAFSLDISKMFYQVLVHEEDRNALRFVWRGFEQTSTPSMFRMRVFAFGLKSSPFVAIKCVLATAEKSKAAFPEAVPILLQQLYMDDCPAGHDDKGKARALVKDLKTILASGSFKAHKFCANDPELLEDLNGAEKLQDGVTKILGIIWNLESDFLTFNFDSKVQDDGEVTKRKIMSQAAQLFDILGMVQPFLLLYKFILQEVWEMKQDYDTEVSEDLRERWIRWKDQIKDLPLIQLPRWSGYMKNAETFLAAFGDASKRAYGAVVYLVVTKADTVTTVLEMSKSRLPPKLLKPTAAKADQPFTIVRLELLAALLATKLGVYVANALSMDPRKIHYFTDSLINLLRIQNGPGGWKQWVANRIRQILENSGIDQWHFVPGHDNPADLASRGCSVRELVDNSLWWHGPRWLRKNKDDWPKQPIRRKTEDEKLADESESRKDEDTVQIYAVQIEGAHFLTRLTERNNRWPKILRVLVWINRYVQCSKKMSGKELQQWRKKHVHDLKQETARKIQVHRDWSPISVKELKAAENRLIRHAQETCFRTEIRALEAGEAVSKKSDIRDLDPKLDDGLLVHCSRLQLSETIPSMEKRPVILPKNNGIARKIVLEVHNVNMHSGTETTHLTMRRKYWLVGGRQQVRKIIRTCKTPKCRPVATLAIKMSPLPVERMDHLVAFKNVAMDFFGPVMVKHQCKLANCPHGDSKAYGLVLTCFQSRALHLELVPDLTTKSFLMAFRRFAGRRGVPEILYSDNARTFTKASKEMAVLRKLNPQQLQDQLAMEMKCEWRFSKAKAPWENGIAERMVQTVKRTLRIVLHANLLTTEEMMTVLVEIEGIINDRPLSCIKDDSLLPITPAELVAGRTLKVIPDPKPSENAKLDYPAMWRKRQAVLNSFWKRWKKDYLMQLSPLKKWRCQDEAQVKEGDVVLLIDQDNQRNSWRLARIAKVLQNSQGIITSAKIQLPNGSVLHRSLRQLALLESDMTVRGPEAEDRNDHGSIVEESKVAVPPDSEDLRRSKRIKKAPTKLTM